MFSLLWKQVETKEKGGEYFPMGQLNSPEVEREWRDKV